MAPLRVLKKRKHCKKKTLVFMRAFLHALVMPRSNAMLRDALP